MGKYHIENKETGLTFCGRQIDGSLILPNLKYGDQPIEPQKICIRCKKMVWIDSQRKVNNHQGLYFRDIRKIEIRKEKKK
jgi:hypothetical protein